jgi:anti-anti-sigma factor
MSMLSLDTGTPPPNRVELASAARDVAVVALFGEHDLGHHEGLKSVLSRAAIRAPYVIMDLAECAFIDATTVALMLHTNNVMGKAGGGFAVVIPPQLGPVSRVAELVRLAEMLSIHPSLESALASFPRSDATPPAGPGGTHSRR